MANITIVIKYVVTYWLSIDTFAFYLDTTVITAVYCLHSHRTEIGPKKVLNNNHSSILPRQSQDGNRSQKGIKQ